VLTVPNVRKHFLSASDAAVSQEFAEGKISIQSSCVLNTRYKPTFISQNKENSLRRDQFGEK
jgi:hypothetical protein